MQQFKILLNPFLSGSTTTESAVGQQVILKNNYYVYSSEIGGDIVNDNNVKSFLDNDDNEELTLKFISYLQSNTTLQEFKDIFYDNKKLAAIFNEFYKNNITTVSKSYAQINKQLSTLSADNSTNSLNDYFINIFAKQTKKTIDDANYSSYFKDCEDTSYIYKRFTIINNFTTSVVFGNQKYIDSIRENQNFGYYTTYDGFTPGTFSVGLPTQYYKDKDIAYVANLKFQSLSQFESVFKFVPPPITTSQPGFFVSKYVMNVKNGATFINEPIVYFDKKLPFISIPLTISLNLASSGDTTLYLKSEDYSTAIKNVDFSFEQPSINPNSQIKSKSDSKQIVISNGNKNITVPFTIYNSIQSDSSIVISLRSGITIVELMLVRVEEMLEIKKHSHDLSLKTINEQKSKLMLRCFVDNNYNDNESEFWHNDNVKLI